MDSWGETLGMHCLLTDAAPCLSMASLCPHQEVPSVIHYVTISRTHPRHSIVEVIQSPMPTSTKVQKNILTSMEGLSPRDNCKHKECLATKFLYSKLLITILQTGWYRQGSYTMSPKKIQDFSRTLNDLFLNFPGPKTTNRQQIFMATTCSELCLGLWLKENKLDKYFLVFITKFNHF